MAYFANGTEGTAYECAYCDRCIHQDSCPIWSLHLDWNYEQLDNDDPVSERTATILEELIPSDEHHMLQQCEMFVPKSLVSTLELVKQFLDAIRTESGIGHALLPFEKLAFEQIDEAVQAALALVEETS